MYSPCISLAVRTAILASAIWISVSSQSFGQQANGTDESSRARSDYGVLLFDSFNGKMGLAWKFVRHDPTHVSFSDRAGMLTIRTQRGTINRDGKAQGWPEAKNLLLVENPLPRDADFQVTTCLSGFRPNELFQQAGLLLYNDDDNYLKWIIQFNRTAGAGQVYSLLTERDAASEFRHHETPDVDDKLWLRVVKRRGSYSACGSTDGKQFKVLETRDWPVDGPTKIGLVAKNGGGLQDAQEMDAHFDFFELKSPPDDAPNHAP
jgi:regulation of enolase protein 1 (concanavalin A-like superfamily)